MLDASRWSERALKLRNWVTWHARRWLQSSIRRSTFCDVLLRLGRQPPVLGGMGRLGMQLECLPENRYLLLTE